MRNEVWAGKPQCQHYDGGLQPKYTSSAFREARKSPVPWGWTLGTSPGALRVVVYNADKELVRTSDKQYCAQGKCPALMVVGVPLRTATGLQEGGHPDCPGGRDSKQKTIKENLEEICGKAKECLDQQSSGGTFPAGWVSPAHSPRVDGPALEGKELEFLLRKIKAGKTNKFSSLLSLVM